MLSSRLVKLNTLIRFWKMSNDSDERIDISSSDQMTGPRYIGQAVFAISNSPKSRYDEIMISKRFPLILSTPPVHV